MAKKMDKVRIAIVGVGSIGEVHLQCYMDNPLCEVVALCERDEARLAQMQSQYGIAAAYTDQAEMHNREGIDGVVIATPDEHHLNPVQIAADADVSIMLEKPIATTLEDAEAIVRIGKGMDKKLMMGFTLRWMPHYASLQQRIAQGEFGTLINAFARRAFRRMEPRRIGGRCTVNQYLASHDVDYLLWTFGTDLESVYSTTGDFILKEELGVSDYYWNILKWKNGATAAVHTSWIEPDGYPNHLEMELILNGTDAGAHMLLGGQELVVANDRTSDKPGISYPPAVTLAYPIEAAHFVECIHFDQTPLTNAVDGLNSLRVLFAAEASVAEKRTVGVELIPNQG